VHRYIIKRLVMLIPVILGVSFLVFFMMELAPGDVTDVLGDGWTEEDLAALRAELNLDKNVFERYLIYMWDLLHGDMGYSPMLKQSVWDLYAQRFPNTLLLTLWAAVLCAVVSVPLGIFAALHRGTFIDNLCTAGALLGMSIPHFWLGLLLIILFSQTLGWLPSYGSDGSIKSVIMPVITVGTGGMATMTRITRSAMLDVLQADYMRTARSKGVDERVVVNKHGLRNALIPIITIFGSQLGISLGGSLVTENVFTWPGIGQLLVNAIKQRDTTLVCGLLIMSVIVICLMQLLVDLAYAFVDPRLKGQYLSPSKKKKAKEGANA